MKRNTNLKEIGIFLIGVALVIIAVILALIYRLFTNQINKYESIYYTYCESGKDQNFYIVITANVNLENVIVKDTNNTVICNFTHLPAKSERVCRVNQEGMYIVKSGEYEKLARCIRYEPLLPLSMNVTR
ncbi:MAG: hypothetical protein ACP5JK_02235 [Candidatus Aenigmatarchaeota archaeon]